LPGIGTFLLDNASLSALQNSKQRSAVLDGVRFESKPLLKDTPDLIAFIAEKTGKMKALAAADLDSHLVLAEEFLNIGKPFAFEGIGIITKLKPGEFDFTPVSILTEKVKDFQAKDTEPAPAKEPNSEKKYESFLSPSKTKAGWKKPVVGLILVCGIGAAVWGGYVISQRVKKNNQAILSENKQPEAQPVMDSVTVSKDTTATPIIQQPEPDYKYVLEVAKSKRAFKRYNQLKELDWNVQIETNDSIDYKLFMRLPVTDTIKTLDSLIAMTGRKVYIEH
jgi:hypothetical protein